MRLLREAMALEDAIPYNEPPVWHQPVRQVLGALLLEAGRPAEAEVLPRATSRGSARTAGRCSASWQSLVAQHRLDEAQQVRARYDRAWARADVSLTSSRMLTSDQPNRTADAATDKEEKPMVKS